MLRIIKAPILAGENLGYGKANNLGLKEVKTKYALILNPDTFISLGLVLFGLGVPLSSTVYI